MIIELLNKIFIIEIYSLPQILGIFPLEKSTSPLFLVFSFVKINRVVEGCSQSIRQDSSPMLDCIIIPHSPFFLIFILLLLSFLIFLVFQVLICCIRLGVVSLVSFDQVVKRRINRATGTKKHNSPHYNQQLRFMRLSKSPPQK